LNTPDNTISLSIRLFSEGDNNALAQLYKNWLPELYLVSYRYVKSQEEAEDVVADCFEKLLRMDVAVRKQKFIAEEINLKALLLVMVKNKSLDVLKTSKNRSRIVDNIKGLIPLIGYNKAEQNLSDDNFKKMLCCLPEKEQKIAELHIDGFSLEEISKQLNISEKTVSNLLALSRKKIRTLWSSFMK
jgi:RNA polymerase sigma factor (sigma-70 family)